MILNYNQWLEHNKRFYNTFIDLKVVGWDTYSKALNAYTLNFYKEQLYECDKVVHTLADAMRASTKK